MKRICLLICLLLALPTMALAAGTESEDGTVRVYLKSMGTVSRLHITTEGDYTVNAGEGMRFSDGAQMTVIAYEDSLYLTCGAITLEMGPSFTLTRHGDTGGLYLDGSQRGLIYMGDLELTLTENAVMPILVIGLEDYVKGVVPYEMSDSFPQEALKAQSVAARTYVLYMRQKGKYPNYDVVDTTGDQVFMGYDPANANAIAACEATEGLVGMYNDRYALCYYTASNGGQTALPAEVWSDSGDWGHLSRREDPYDLANSRSVVKSAEILPDGTGLTEDMHTLLLTAAAEPLAALGYSDETRDISLERITAMEVAEPDPQDSRHYTVLRIGYTLRGRPCRPVEAEEGEQPAPAPGSEPASLPRVECVLGEMETVDHTFTVDIPLFDTVKEGLSLRINGGDYELFSVETQTDTEGQITAYTVSSRRYGHGVGMSQRGAQEMAGVCSMTCEDILGFYYPGMTLETVSFSTPVRDPLPPLFGQKEPDLSQLQEGERMGTVRVAGIAAALNIRSQPTTQSEIVGLAYEGDRLIVGEETESGWYQVRTENFSGYAAAEYIETD